MYIYDRPSQRYDERTQVEGLEGPAPQRQRASSGKSADTATWTDWLDQNASKKVRRYVPSSVDDVVHAVKNERRLRTIGAGHADNRLGRPDDGTAMIDPQRLSGVSLVRKTPRGALVYIGAGTRVCDVNRRLWEMELALPNMGSFDQQYFAGAVGTGTHGSGASLGPFADLLCSVDLVDGTGQPWRIEDPAQPLTAKAAFTASNGNRKLVQDDLALWRSVGVHAGALGSVTGMVLTVVDRYKLWETRRASTYEALPKDTAEWKEILKAVRHWEALICPYPSEDGTHFAVITRRDIAAPDLGDVPVPPLTDDPDKLPPNSRHVLHELKRAFSRSVVTTLPIGHWIVHHPDQARGLLRFGMKNLIPKQQRRHDFVDRSYRILLLGIGARAHGYEMAVPLENVNKVVKVILTVAEAWNHPDRNKHDRCVFTSPFSLRFVKSGPQFIGTNGRERAGAPPSDIWCFIEIPRLWIPDEKEKKREFPYYPDAALQMIWGACREFGVRSHWGQQEFMLASDLRALYPNLAAWKLQAARLDPDRKFANRRALELGLRT
jgi:FAD binding domain/D-arabinono-1,4-lactone oxidase